MFIQRKRIVLKEKNKYLICEKVQSFQSLNYEKIHNQKGITECRQQNYADKEKR